MPPISLYLSWCFAEGMSFLRQKQRASSWKRWEKQKLDYVNIVWKWCDQIPTWWNQAEIIAVGKTNTPYSKRIGELHQGQAALSHHVLLRNELIETTYSLAHVCCSTNGVSFSSMSSDSVTIQSSATLLYLSWLAFCQLELRSFPSLLCNSRIICIHTFII